MLYRALISLDKHDRIIPAGSLISGVEFSPVSLERLLSLGKIAPVASPPLSILPNWKARSRKLEGLGIVTIEQLIEVTDLNSLAGKLEISRVTLSLWIEDAKQKLLAPTSSKG